MTNANVGVHTGKLTMSYSSDEAVSVTEVAKYCYISV